MAHDPFASLLQSLRAALFDGCGVGIDLGTSNSRLAIAEQDGDDIYCEASEINDEGRTDAGFAMPSVLALTDTRVLVGHAAERLKLNKGFKQGQNFFALTKSEIGHGCEYPAAPRGFRTPTQIAGFLIDQLIIGSSIGDRPHADHWVLGVPASFDASQRSASLRAAVSTGLIAPGHVSLIDEPLAVLLDLCFRRPEVIDQLRCGGSCLSFDFGGTACDVAIYEFDTGDATLLPRLRASCRDARIGGVDIDRAIVRHHLMPELLKRCGIAACEVSDEDRLTVFEPALLAPAEKLKRQLCLRLRAAAHPDSDDPDLDVSLDGYFKVHWRGRSLHLCDPSLRCEAFEAMLAPIVGFSSNGSFEPQSGARVSMFAPILHALSCGELQADEIGLVLISGCSSLIPQVRSALAAYFPKAALLEPGDSTDFDVSASRGAALQALSIAGTGSPLIAWQ